MATYIPGPTNRESLTRWHADGCEIYMTNGVFDLFHAGHINYLLWIARFKRPKDLLMVGINSDKATLKLKGPGRPIMDFNERSEAVMTLPWVDYVTRIENDACELIKAIHPDTYIKGEDWRGKPMTEVELVRGLGGRVIYAPFKHGLSTTEIIARVLAAGNEKDA